MLGRGSDDEPDVEKERERDRQHRIHSQAINAPQERDGETAEILRQLSEIKDLPINPEDDPIMGQLVSKLTSTANLTPEQVRSNEWVREYILVLYLSLRPKREGLHGGWRAWAHDDLMEYKEPLDTEDRMTLEMLVSTSKLGLSRSEGFRAVEESTRTVQESVLRDESQGDGGSGGILGRMGLK